MKRTILALGALLLMPPAAVHAEDNLGYSGGVWPYMSAEVALWHLRLGETREAWHILDAGKVTPLTGAGAVD
jgi:hypothetical protein